ncbi:MAG: hypothetical protein RSD57_10190 [Comamonas sp.]
MGFAWLYLTPLFTGFVSLLALAAYKRLIGWRSLAQACGLLVVLAVPLVFGLAMSLPYWLLVRDTPVMWAPFAWMAVALALPVAARRLMR